MSEGRINDVYSECIYVKRLTTVTSKQDKAGVYVFVEVDNEKGTRVSAVDSIDSEKPRILRDMRLDNSLNTQHLEVLA